MKSENVYIGQVRIKYRWGIVWRVIMHTIKGLYMALKGYEETLTRK
jgi:hypothetical protein